MKKIKNPFVNDKDYKCFGCAPKIKNPYGLAMEFYEDDEYIISQWDPVSFMQGYDNILHGGIQAALMDEIAAWTVYIKLETGGVTSKLEVQYKKPVPVHKGLLTIKAKVQDVKRNLVFIETTLLNSDNEVCATGLITYYLIKGKSKVIPSYPGKQAFF